MNHIKRLCALLLIILASACDNTEDKSTTTPLTTIPADTTTKQPVQQPTVPATGTVALNPAHGMPGHRCDIKVGEPLNSLPTLAPDMSKPPPAIPPSPSQSTSGSGAKNPAHGMPGHRCDIAVGAPLNSMPTQ